MRSALILIFCVGLFVFTGCKHSGNPSDKPTYNEKKVINDMNQVNLLAKYKYVLFADYTKKEVFYTQDQLEIRRIVDWLDHYYPDKKIIKKYRRTVLPHYDIIFTNSQPETYADIYHETIRSKMSFDIYINFYTPGKYYFTPEQVNILCKIFEKNSIQMKLKGKFSDIY